MPLFMETLEKRALLSGSPAPVEVFAPHTHGVAEASARWWKWAVSFDGTQSNPFTDATGAGANLKQSGPVYFLGGTAGDPASRAFNVPDHKRILIPLLVGELSQIEGAGNTPAQVTAAAKAQADMIDSLHASIDGVAVPMSTLFAHREVSPVFHFTAVTNNLFVTPAPPATLPAESGIAVADGYWLELAPLPEGTHVINFGGAISAFGFSIDVTDTITVGDGHENENSREAAIAPSVRDQGHDWSLTKKDDDVLGRSDGSLF